MNETQRRYHGTVQAAAESGRLDKICTPTEARRMQAYCIDGLLLKEIAWEEAASIPCVSRSISRGIEKLREGTP